MHEVMYEEARKKAYEVTTYPLSIKFLDNCTDLVWIAGYSPYKKEGLYTLYSNKSAGCCSQTEAKILTNICRILKPIIVTEIGSFIGWSTVHLAEYSRLVIAVDNFSEGEVKEVFLENTKPYTNISLVESDSVEYLKETRYNSDIIFIDGYHHNSQPLKDTYGALYNLKENGIIILHDTWEKDVELAGDYLKVMGFEEHIFDTDNQMAIYCKDKVKLEWLLEILPQ